MYIWSKVTVDDNNILFNPFTGRTEHFKSSEGIYTNVGLKPSHGAYRTAKQSVRVNY